MAALVDEETIIAAVPSFESVEASERTRRILAASAAVEAYVGRPLAQATFVEKHRPGGTRLIYLRATPVASVTSIVYGPSGSETTIADYSVDEETGVLELYQSIGVGYRYPDRTYGSDPRSGTVTVTYVGGYALADVPADLQEYVIRTVLAGGAILGLSGAGMFASEQIGSYSYRLSTSSDSSAVSSGLPASVMAGLKRYRRPRFS